MLLKGLLLLPVKLATKEDLPSLVPLVKEFINSYLPGASFSEEVTLETLESITNNPVETACILIWDTEGTPSGILIGVIAPRPFSEEVDSVELCFFVSPSARKSEAGKKLFDTYEYWAEHIAKVDYINASCIDEKVSVLFKRKKYSPAEYLFRKKV